MHMIKILSQTLSNSNSTNIEQILRARYEIGPDIKLFNLILIKIPKYVVIIIILQLQKMMLKDTNKWKNEI